LPVGEEAAAEAGRPSVIGEAVRGISRRASELVERQRSEGRELTF
jgi:hypothetical protein